MSRNPGEETDLVRRAQAGDREAFKRLAQLQAEPLYRCALALCRHRHLAEDLAQETLVEAWRGLARFDGRCRFSTWLYGILRHRFLKSWRRADTRFSPLSGTASDLVEQSGSSPAQAAEQTEDATRVRAAVAGLPDEHRPVIELRFFAGRSLEEIAAALDISLGTVKSRLHYGLEKLRKLNLAVNLLDADRE